jgi:aminopeptidase N
MTSPAHAITLLASLLLASPAAYAQTRIVLPSDVSPVHYDVSIVPDAAHLTFSGSVKIDLDVKQPTSKIELNAADLAFTKVSFSGMNAAPKVTFDTKNEQATLAFAQPVSAGHHVLSIDYTGKINQHAAGLFALDYETAIGKKRALFTQFENSDARRFIPSWDEPSRKATFALTATVPADEMAVSNTPIQAADNLPGGLKRVHFATSPKMSSYLLFFGLGDFERLSRKVNGVDIGVVVKRGDTAKAQYALDAASHILPFYEDYFGVKYPLPKLDLVAGPGSSQFFGAMENWGAIFYFERGLEIDPKISTEADKRGVYIVIAHEMAHQWFGDLVTMAWWDDLWLNEGFAEWMQTKATDHFHPEWELWLDAVNQKEAAMRTDARFGTHPVVRPIYDVLQANQAFDAITYEKGQAVVWMLEHHVGSDTFRAGVRNYIKAHAYGNTVTDDLWRELDKASPAKVTQIAHDFTLQAGVPLIRIASVPGGLRLTQDRFADDASGKVDSLWHVPVTVAGLDSHIIWRGIVSRDAPADVKLPAGTAPIVNAGQSGYFRTLYSPDTLKPLAAHFAQLSAVDQLGLINDSRALGYSGYQPLTDFMDIAAKADATMNHAVLATLVGRLEGIDTLYNDLPGQAAYRAVGRKLLDPIFATVGWDAKPGENQNTALLREELIDALSEFDDAAVIAGARKRFAAFLANHDALAPDLRHSVLQAVAHHADAATWEQLHQLAKTTTNSLEKEQYYRLLGSVWDRKLAQHALDLAMTDEAVVTTRPNIIRAVSQRCPDLAFDFTVAHWDRVRQMLEPDSRNQYVPRLVSGAYDQALEARLQAFADKNIPASAREEVVKAKAAIAYYAQVRKNRLPEVDRWLAHA